MTDDADDDVPDVSSGKVYKARWGSADKPLKLAGIEIPCYVLEDGRRVIIQSGVMKALNMAQGTASKRGDGDRLERFITTKGVNKFVTGHLAEMITHPLKLRVASMGKTGVLAYGYDASVLTDLVNAILLAEKNGTLNYQTAHIVERARTLQKAFAHVGLIALIDEATGFQTVRAREELEQILDRYIRKEWAKWARRFPDEFYQQMFRLRGWAYTDESLKRRPGVVGRWTNDMVYARLAPLVLERLEKTNPKTEAGHRRHRHHQYLTDDIGHPQLQEHLAVVIALMKASSSWGMFKRLLERAKPRFEETMALFPDWDPELDQDAEKEPPEG